MTYPQQCPCGSGEFPEAVHDARGIFVSYVCDRCRKEKLSGYKPEIFDNPSYYFGEPIEEDL